MHFSYSIQTETVQIKVPGSDITNDAEDLFHTCVLLVKGIPWNTGFSEEPVFTSVRSYLAA